MKIKEIISVLEEMAPLAYAEDFDNVGLLVGDKERKHRSFSLPRCFRKCD